MAPAAAQDSADAGSPLQEPGQLEGEGAEVEEAPSASAPPAIPDVEVITVKGQRRDLILQDTASSVTAFDTQDLEDLRIQNISDLAEYTPNLDINTRSAASNPTLFIRGIGLKDYNANAAGAVAVYQDGININSPAIQLFQLYDVGSIEVLRGPQGSGPGRNATAGAIKVNSVQPDGVWGGTGSFTYGNYNTIEAEGAVSLPIIDEMLAARLAFTANFADGNTKNQCAGWDPEAHGFRKVTQGTIESTYAALQAGAEPVLVFPRADRKPRPGDQPELWYPYLTQDTDLLRQEQSQNGMALGRLASDPNRIVGKQADLYTTRDDLVDHVCITKSPGDVVTFRGAGVYGQEGEFLKRNVPALEDFQGLKSTINNVHDWAARGILRFTSMEDLDWRLNAPRGRNRSASRRL